MIDSFEAVAIFLFFLPGIVGAVLYRAIAETAESGEVQTIMTAVALTLVSTVVAGALFSIPISGAFSIGTEVGEATLKGLLDSFAGSEAMIRTGLACGLAVVAAAATNKAWLYKVASRVGLTRRTGAIDPWHEAFRSYPNRWLRIRFVNGDKLIGWIRWYSEDGDEKLIFLGRATWHIRSDGAGADSKPLFDAIDVAGPGVLVSNFDSVVGIDFVD